MSELKLGVVEARFADIIWQNEPLSSNQLAKLAEQGELLRRYQGYDKGPIPTEELFRLSLSPLEVPLAKDAIARAVQAGFRREEGPAKKEVDKGLLELEKKTGAS